MPPARALQPPEEHPGHRARRRHDSTEGTAAIVDAPVVFEAGTSSSATASTTSRTRRTSAGTTSVATSSHFPATPAAADRLHDLRQPDVVAKETYAGVLFPNPSQFFGAHRRQQPPVGVRVRGQYYFTYHAPTLNSASTATPPRVTAARTSRSSTSTRTARSSRSSAPMPAWTSTKLRAVPRLRGRDLRLEQGCRDREDRRQLRAVRCAAPNLVIRDIDNGDWTALSSVDFGDNGAQADGRVRRSPPAGRSRCARRRRRPRGRHDPGRHPVRPVGRGDRRARRRERRARRRISPSPARPASTSSRSTTGPSRRPPDPSCPSRSPPRRGAWVARRTWRCRRATTTTRRWRSHWRPRTASGRSRPSRQGRTPTSRSTPVPVGAAGSATVRVTGSIGGQDVTTVRTVPHPPAPAADNPFCMRTEIT